MKQLTLLAGSIAILVAGCAQPETAADGTGQAGAGTADAQPAAEAPAPVEAAAPTEYEFYLLPRDGKPTSDPRIVSTSEHPCGPIDLVRVTSIPMNDPAFVPQFVVEFDSNGKEIAKWGMANEAQVVALDGQRLQFQTESGRFWVAQDGALEKLADTSRAEDLRAMDNMVDCPDLPTFSKSEVEQCFRMPDTSGKVRFIAVEPVCS